MVKKTSDNKVKIITQRLEKHFGTPTWQGRGKPLNSLINTILSQSTNDRNRDMGYNQLKERFPNWDAVRLAPVSEIADAIRPAGLANQKSERIKNILQWVKENYGSLDLDCLCDEPPEHVIDKFLQLKGIGFKTITVVLMFSCGVDVFPVDTHVHRICKRIGLVPSNSSAEKTYHLMQPKVPKDKSYSLHINMIHFGRAICKARNPKCPICPLSDLCDSAFTFSNN
jgi:endonuclease III